MSSAHFDNAAVTGATNPSAFGYHHGPIPNNNIGWLPARQQEHIDNGGSARNAPNVTVDDNADPPNAAVHLSSINTGVCGIDVGGGTMCGITFAAQPAFRRHLRNAHPGAITNPSRVNTSIQETVAGQNAIKLYVRSGGWRNADFALEPGRGPPGGFIDRYATTCEEIARNDAAFASNFGTHFHRPPQIKLKVKRKFDNTFSDISINVASSTLTQTQHMPSTTTTAILHKQFQPLIATPSSSAKRKRGNDPPQSPESPTRDKGKKKSRSAVKPTSGPGSRKSTRTRASAAANEA